MLRFMHERPADCNPYRSPPETGVEKRRFDRTVCITVASLAVALTLVFFDAPRSLVVVAGACSVWAADARINRFWD